MCFKNLPIDFDESGRASLRPGVADPYSVAMAEPKGYVRRKEGPGAQLAAPPRLRDWNIDPMTRGAGALAVRSRSSTRCTPSTSTATRVATARPTARPTRVGVATASRPATTGSRPGR